MQSVSSLWRMHHRQHLYLGRRGTGLRGNNALTCLHPKHGGLTWLTTSQSCTSSTIFPCSIWHPMPRISKVLASRDAAVNSSSASMSSSSDLRATPHLILKVQQWRKRKGSPIHPWGSSKTMEVMAIASPARRWTWVRLRLVLILIWNTNLKGSALLLVLSLRSAPGTAFFGLVDLKPGILLAFSLQSSASRKHHIFMLFFVSSVLPSPQCASSLVCWFPRTCHCHGARPPGHSNGQVWWKVLGPACPRVPYFWLQDWGDDRGCTTSTTLRCLSLTWGLSIRWRMLLPTMTQPHCQNLSVLLVIYQMDAAWVCWLATWMAALCKSWRSWTFGRGFMQRMLETIVQVPLMLLSFDQALGKWRRRCSLWSNGCLVSMCLCLPLTRSPTNSWLLGDLILPSGHLQMRNFWPGSNTSTRTCPNANLRTSNYIGFFAISKKIAVLLSVAGLRPRCASWPRTGRCAVGNGLSPSYVLSQASPCQWADALAVSTLHELCLHVFGVAGCWKNAWYHHYEYACHGPLSCITFESSYTAWVATGQVLGQFPAQGGKYPWRSFPWSPQPKRLTWLTWNPLWQQRKAKCAMAGTMMWN